MSQSKLMNTKVAERVEHHVQSFPPAITFAKSKKSKEKKESSDYREFEMRLDPDNVNSQKTKKSAYVFEIGDAETWCHWRKQVDDMCLLLNATTAAAQTKIIQSLLRGRALESFQTYRQSNATNHAQWDEAKILKHTLNDMAVEIFPVKNAYRQQKTYMKYHLFIGNGVTVKQFEHRITWMNQSLKYFPLIKLGNGQYRDCTPMPEDEICEIINIAKKPEWTATMMGANIDPYDLTKPQLIEYLERLEVMDAMLAPIENNKKKKKQNKRDRDKTASKDDEDSSRKKRRTARKPCEICGKYHKGKCWHKASNSSGSSSDDRVKLGSGTNKKRMYSLKEITELSHAIHAFGSSANNKRKVSFEKGEADEQINMFKGMKVTSRTKYNSDKDSDVYQHAFITMPNSRPAKRPKQQHRCSEVIVTILGIKQPLRTLIDSGTSSSIIHKQFVDPDRLSDYKGTSTRWRTMGGFFETKRKAQITFQLSEFSLRKTITWSFHVNESHEESHYDMIIGDDLMQDLGIDLLYSTNVPTIQWEHVSIPMKPRGSLDQSNLMKLAYKMIVDLSSKPLRKAEERRIRILDTDSKTYANVDLTAFVQTLEHLTDSQQQLLLTTLQTCPVLFSGGLATARVKPIELELVQGAKPYHLKQPFSIPEAYKPITKKEIDRLCKLGVIEKRSDSEWACGTFIIPKKTHDVRVVTDFRILNSMLVRRPFPIPRIKDLLTSLQGFQYASAIDLSMGYYSIPLSEASQELTTFLLPWGKYRYKRMPMGIKVGTDCFQETMTHILGDLPFVKIYLDDVLLLTNDSYEDHCDKLRTVLNRLDDYNFRCRPDKCHFAVDRVEYLGYDLSRDGLTPQPKKVEAIQRMAAPTTKKALRRFLGMINYYRDMWQRRSHILAPLTAITSNKAEFKWNMEQQQAFDEIKRVISRETILTFPDFSKPFHVFTDASDYQLGGVIMQENKPLAFYSRKLNSAQKNYTTAEKELLSIVKVCREFRDILLGQTLIVHTDHKNLLYRSLPTQRLMRWRMLLEEYDAQYEHIKGTDNVVADGISRLAVKIDNDERPLESVPQIEAQAYALSRIQRNESLSRRMKTNHEDMAASYVSKEDVNETDFPMAPTLISKYQKRDKSLKKAMAKDEKSFHEKEVEGILVIHKKGKIYAPMQLQSRIIEWYHEYLRHPGATRMENTIGQWFTWPRMAEQIRSHCRRCPTCQKWKRQRKKYGHLPPKEAEATPWSQVHVDMMGPLTVTDATGKKYSFLAFTAIDPATGWFECVPVTDTKSYTVMEVFHNAWLCRYPRPRHIRFDNGSEFKSVFKELCDNYHMKAKPTTSYNPRSNGIIERIHQVLRDNLVTFELSKQELPDQNPFDSFVAAASWAIRSTFHSVLRATPGQLVFGRDMLLDLQYKANWAEIRLRKQSLIDKGVMKENKGRIHHDYAIGDKVLYTLPGIIPKMNQPRDGPFRITQVHVNGTLTIQRGSVTDRVNIRNVSPYFE